MKQLQQWIWDFLQIGVVLIVLMLLLGIAGPYLL